MKRYNAEIWVGLFVVVGMICTGYLTIRLGKLDIFKQEDYLLSARFSNVTGLRPGAKVEIAGVQIGKVEKITLDRGEFTAVIDMRIKQVVQLSDDSIASIKTSGLIGDRFVKLSPGGSEKTLPPGGMIRDTESAVDIEELISKYAFGKV